MLIGQTKKKKGTAVRMKAHKEETVTGVEVKRPHLSLHANSKSVKSTMGIQHQLCQSCQNQSRPISVLCHGAYSLKMNLIADKVKVQIQCEK